MPSPYAAYLTPMRDNWGPGWSTYWPLATRFSVGDLCRESEGQPFRVNTEKDLPPVTSRGADTCVYTSNAAAEVHFKAAGTVPAGGFTMDAADAGALVTFSRDRAMFAAFYDISLQEITAVDAVAQTIVRRCHEGTWDRKTFLITHVATAQRATVLMASSRAATAELRLTTTFAQPPAPADLAGNVSVHRSSGLGGEWISGEPCTPFFRAVRARRTFLRKIEIEYSVRGTAQPGSPPGKRADHALEPLLREAAENPSGVLEEIVL